MHALPRWAWASLLSLMLMLQALVQMPAQAQQLKPVPPLRARVNDEVGMLAPDQRARLENVLADYEPEEIVALLSCFVFQERTDSAPNLTPALEQGIETIVKISEKVNRFQTAHQVILSSDDSNDFVSRPRFGLVEVVYEWARGMPFSRIAELTDVLEGTIVRVITRLDETCREAKNAARIIGDPTLFTKMQTCQELIKRDICATASLYM